MGRIQKIDYQKIPGIPTLYHGCKFRSRLEARWAAFFDALNFAWDYEPADLGGWAPDFLIRSHAAPIYVEVKPTVQIDVPVAAKMRRSWAGQSILVGLSPFRYCWAEAAIGWWIAPGDAREPGHPEAPTHPHPAALMRIHKAESPPHWGLGCLITGYSDRITGTEGNPFMDAVSFSDVHQIWNEACSAVQRQYPRSDRGGLGD